YTPLRDLAEMLRSFHYAARHALRDGGIRREDRPLLAPWARLWELWASVAFLQGYWENPAVGALLPPTLAEQDLLLDFYLVKRALNELRYELARGLSRAAIPIQGLLQVLETPAAHAPRVPSAETVPHPR